MARQRYNGLTATLGAALTSSDTTITFAAPLTSAAGAVPTISGGDTIALSLLDAGGAVVEIVSLTTYTSGATTGTITRAQESTTAAAHASGATVVHGPTAADFATGSSGGSSSIKDRLWTPGASEATVDEHNDSSLAAAWVRADDSATASGQTWTEDADVVSVLNTNPAGEGGGKYHGLLRPIGTAMSPGDAFITCVSMLSDYGSGYSMIPGLILADGNTFGAGSQLLGTYFFDQPSGKMQANLNSLTNFAATSTLTTKNLGSRPQSRIFLRIVMTAANTWRLDVSLDGVSWITSATGARTLTPTHIGYATSNPSTATATATFEFLRRTSGVS